MLRFILSFALLSFSASCFALSPREAKDSYSACISFLKQSPDQQKVIAKKSGYYLKKVTWACELQKRLGLRQMQRNERNYQDGVRGYPRNSGGSSQESDPYGGSGGGFAGPGSCTNGTCNGPGGVTVCTNGTCN
jgi:hypothetical protein